MRGLIMRVGAVIVLALAATALGDIVSTPLNCSGTYDINTPYREFDFDFGVTFSAISNVYIAWSGEITAGLTNYTIDPCNLSPLDVGIRAGFSSPFRRAEIWGGVAYYPEPEPFHSLSRIQPRNWTDLLDGLGRITIQYTELASPPEGSQYIYIESGSVTLNDATLLIGGTVIREPASDVKFYSESIIEDDDVYNIVRVFDTSPEHTIIDMYGGCINQLQTYDLSTVNIYGGGIQEEIVCDNESTVNIYGGEIRGAIDIYNGSKVNIYGGSIICSSFSVMESSTLNIYGGELLVIDSPIFYKSNAVNLYGYGFEYEAGNLIGFLSDGSEFRFRRLSSDEYSLMNLIEVPEPISANVEIHPKTLNISSEGRWINCRIRLPEDCNASDINTDSVLLEGRVKAESTSFNQKHQCANVKFDRSSLSDIIEPGEVELIVKGYLDNGTYFEGMDSIQVIDKGSKNK